LEIELINREREVQRQWEDSKIAKARYNRRYKEIRLEGRVPRYLKKENIEDLRKGDEMRALIKLRYGNLEQANKYWVEEKLKRCIFCEEGMDCIEHFIIDCRKTREWFMILGEDKDKILEKIWDKNLENIKGSLLKEFWKEREKELKKRTLKEREEEVNLTEAGLE